MSDAVAAALATDGREPRNGGTGAQETTSGFDVALLFVLFLKEVVLGRLGGVFVHVGFMGII